MVDLPKKTKIIILISLLIFVAGVFFYFSLATFKNYLILKQKEKETVLQATTRLCEQFPSARAIDETKDYVEIYQKNIKNSIDKFSFLLEQYDFCRLWQGASQNEVFNQYLSEQERNSALTHFAIHEASNKIFKSTSCDSPEIIQYSYRLKNLTPELKDVYAEKICHFFKNGGLDEELKTFCLGNRNCFIILKNERDLYKEMLLDGKEEKSREDSFKYITALRTNNKKYCPEINDWFARIACQIYFIDNNPNYCDKIFNELNQETCSYQK